MTILIIVESPNKTKKIESYLGPGFKVMASVGHIRDLPENEMGVEPPNFQPKYVASKKSQSVISRLKKAAQAADQVLLATDPDREGEAIAWHLLDSLKLKSYKRVQFKAITKSAIKEAINNPGEIDMAKVAAQEARRVLDRLVGYTVSPLLKTMTGSVTAMSAGRVQTPAVLLVVLADRAIDEFKPVDHYKLKALFPWPGKSGVTWAATWQHKPLQKALGLEETDHFKDSAFVSQVASALQQQNQFLVYKVDQKDTFRKPPSPFSTSLMQQVANTKLGLGVDETMAAAQSLFDQGYITYLRTDSLNIDDSASDEIRSWLSSNGFAVPDQRNTWQSKAGAQEAHEAIRPTDVSLKQPSEFPADSHAGKLYRLIWERSVASQMEPAKYHSTTAIIVSALKVQGQNLQFIARGRVLLSEGWLKLTPERPGEDADGNEVGDAGNEEESDSALPPLEEGTRLTCLEGKPLTVTTKPPARLTISSLVKALEANGIGRPSTFASIIKVIISRGYIEVKGKKVFATQLGVKVTDLLASKFSFASLDFTRVMEGGLDKIAAGQTSYLTVVKYQHERLMREVEAVNSTLDHESISAARKDAFGDLTDCPICGKGSLIRRKGKAGHYWACTAYPTCTASCSDKSAKGKEPEPDLSTIRTKDLTPAVESEGLCPKCNKHKLRQRNGTNGPFWSCAGFPKCKASFNDLDGKPVLEPK